MRIRIAATVLAGLALAAIAAPVRSGTSLQVPVGPRGIAMGGAFSAVVDDATATYWNPAGLPWIGHQEIATAHADLFGSGIKDDYASFVLPLSRSLAVATDFYHSGFSDAEFDFGESRLGLSLGQQLTSFISAGASVKYLSRHTDLDAVTVRRGAGVGLDLGLSVRPISALRVAAVAQDVFDTRITYSVGGGTVVAFPRTLRVGAAYTPIPRGILAVDADDRLHVGAEYAPIEPIALRAGFYDDVGGPDERTLTFGAGLRWSTLRFDYALVDHPTLGTTSHFGLSLGFNFNPSQIRIERVAANDLYTSLYKTYASEPFGSVRVRNLEDQPITTRLRVLVPALMRQPSEQEVVLRPGITQEIPLTAVIPEDVLARSGDRRVQVQITASYQSLRLPRTERATARCVAYGPGAIDWSRGVAQAAAFVTTRDPMIESVARDAVRVGSAAGTTGNRNLDFAAAIFDAVETMGVRYVPDPNTPYATVSGTPKAVDTIYYPRETLARGAGDCDDTSVLLSALLGNVGVRTQFVDVPGHVLLLASTDVHVRNQLGLGIDDRFYVADGDEIWIPLETTALGKGFAEAWRLGAESYADWASRGRAQHVDVATAQQRFEPGELPAAATSLRPIDARALVSRVGSDVQVLESWRKSWSEKRFGDLRDSLHISPIAQNELARAYFLAGRFADADARLEAALADEPGAARTRNNLGVVRAAQGRLAEAIQGFEAATELDDGDAGIWLNLGLTREVAGDSSGAEVALDRGIILSGGYAEACALLGLTAEESPEIREGSSRMTVAEARALLKAAVRRVPAPSASTPRLAPAKPRRWTSRIAGGRSTERAEFTDLLYWKL